jgi:hypothetical protein
MRWPGKENKGIAMPMPLLGGRTFSGRTKFEEHQERIYDLYQTPSWIWKIYRFTEPVNISETETEVEEEYITNVKRDVRSATTVPRCSNPQPPSHAKRRHL